MLLYHLQLKLYPGVAQFGSALEWGSRGRWFDSSHSDHPKTLKSVGFIPLLRVSFFCESKLFHYFFIVSDRFFTIFHFSSRLITFISLLIQQIAHNITAKRGGLFKLMSINR